MKKYSTVSFIILIITAILLTGCGDKREIKELGNTFELDLKDAEILSHYDDHGGFLGDGTLCYVFEFPNDRIKKSMEANIHWHPLPFSDSLSQFASGSSSEGAFYGEYAEPGTMLPDVKNGCWFFYDRHSDSTNPYDDSNLNNRYSYNFTAAVYDTDTNRLYCLKFDT